MSEVKKYTFDEICESGDFNHEEEFVLHSDFEKLKAQLEMAESALNKAINSAEFFSRHADCRKDSWACKCEFCKNTTASKELREAREYFKEKGQK